MSTVGGTNSPGTGGGSSIKYVVYKQPLSLDRFFVHEVTPAESAISKLDNAFVLVCLNRFQQIVTVHTFQTESEQIKVLKSKRKLYGGNIVTVIYSGIQHNTFKPN